MLTNKVPEQDVHDLFTRVAPKYDLMNNIVSLGIQKSWRKKFLRQLDLNKNSICLDLCCGSADSTIDLAKKAKLVTGLDFNQEMLKIAQKKIRQKQLQSKIKLIAGDAMNLPFDDASFDYVTIGFGLRNVPDYLGALKEMERVLKPGGMIVCLETSQPTLPVFKQVYRLYFKFVMPIFGKLFTKSKEEYEWLQQSTFDFPGKEKLKRLFEQAGFSNIKVRSFTGGVAAMHLGYKQK